MFNVFPIADKYNTGSVFAIDGLVTNGKSAEKEPPKKR
jgi:hypothetical protein